MPITITGTGDSRNIVAINTDDPKNIQVEIRGDSHHPEDLQYFNFDFEGTPGEEYVLHITNAHAARYPNWNAHGVPFQTSVSYDEGKTWSYVTTTYDESVPKEERKLTMSFRMPEGQSKMQLAFFPPYTYAQHLDLIEAAKAEAAKADSLWMVTSLGKTKEAPKPKSTWGFSSRSRTTLTEEGRDISMITIGQPGPEKKNIVVIARQHPGEPQAEWYMDGLIRRLQASMQEHTDLFDNVVLHLVPNMNPDGTFTGNLRTNGKGKDLNRQWQNPSIEESPEVYYLLKAMEAMGGVSLFMDVHSDEDIPRGAFLDLGHHNCVTADETVQAIEDAVLGAFLENPDTQDTLTYPKDKVREASNLAFSNAYVAEHFKCPSIILEMPTKEWTVEKCQNLGADLLRVIRQTLTMLPKPSVEQVREAEGAEAPAQLQTTVRAPGRFSVIDSVTRRMNPRGAAAYAASTTAAQGDAVVNTDDAVAAIPGHESDAPPPPAACCAMS